VQYKKENLLFNNTHLLYYLYFDHCHIFDEVKTNFTVGRGGFTSNMKTVEPDIITIGKSIGGGTPIGAVGMREELSALVAAGPPLSIRWLIVYRLSLFSFLLFSLFFSSLLFLFHSILIKLSKYITGNPPTCGTFNGNPLSMAAALAMIEKVMDNETWERTCNLNKTLHNKISAIIEEFNLPAQVSNKGYFSLHMKCVACKLHFLIFCDLGNYGGIKRVH
jgi:glutamate-1-semialdehyde 2,1-aminomutase